MTDKFSYISQNSGSEFKNQGHFEPGIPVSAGQKFQVISRIILASQSMKRYILQKLKLNFGTKLDCLSLYWRLQAIKIQN